MISKIFTKDKLLSHLKVLEYTECKNDKSMQVTPADQDIQIQCIINGVVEEGSCDSSVRSEPQGNLTRSQWSKEAVKR